MQKQLLSIINDSNLLPGQKTQQLAQFADSLVDYLPLSAATQQAKDNNLICDMYEGHAPFKPRYVLPDYQLFLQQGSQYLELEPAQDFDDALNNLMILYHFVPSVTNIPVFIGHLDQLLMPYVGELSEEQIYSKLKRFWIMLDRVLPDAFMHANIGPSDNIVCRTILKIDAELAQIAPNLSLLFDTENTPESLLLQACENITTTSKPHIVNHNMHKQKYAEKGYGVVSCYNVLPVAGGCNTLVRVNLKGVAEQANSIADFMKVQLPLYCQTAYELIEARCQFLHKDSHFFNHFLVQEGILNEKRFAPMFGIFGMAECISTLFSKEQLQGHYGEDQNANALALEITQLVAKIVDQTEVTYGYHGRALLHSQGGLNSDVDVTPGIRIEYGTEPDPITHLMSLAPQHQYFTSGVSEILTLEPTVRSNPQAIQQLCKGAFNHGIGIFTANVASNDLVRITGYMVRMSDINKLSEQGSRTNTTALADGAIRSTHVSQRQPRVISHEFNHWQNK